MKRPDPGKPISNELGDFTTTPRLLRISPLALGVGAISAFVALGLLKLIALFTNIFFYQRISTDGVQPAGHHLGFLVIFVPIIGGVIIGFMAKYGSERIRGHGIPEAIEAILLNGSRVEPKLAILKPVSSAISIGSGGPFGAEGTDIMTAAHLVRWRRSFFTSQAPSEKRCWLRAQREVCRQRLLRRSLRQYLAAPCGSRSRLSSSRWNSRMISMRCCRCSCRSLWRTHLRY